MTKIEEVRINVEIDVRRREEKRSREDRPALLPYGRGQAAPPVYRGAEYDLRRREHDGHAERACRHDMRHERRAILMVLRKGHGGAYARRARILRKDWQDYDRAGIGSALITKSRPKGRLFPVGMGFCMGFSSWRSKAKI